MIFTTIFNFIILTSIIGYSFALKSVFLQSNKEILNLDILYGIFLLVFFSTFFNFFFPLKYFFIPSILIGLIFFYICVIKKLLKVNLILHFFLILFFVYITYDHGNNVDSPMYHLQLIKWMYNEKIVFGLSNLEIRFGSNSLWYTLLSAFQIKLNNFNSIYTLSIIPFVILLCEVFYKEKKLSYIFIFLSVCFLIFFSYLHPFKNGIILNHLRNPEVDTVGMVFFIISFYLFLKCIENRNIQSFNLLLISSMICFFTKISYIGVIILPFIILFLFYRKNISDIFLQKLNLLIIFTFILWLSKNFIISGCFIFPLKFTCFDVFWSAGINEVDYYSKVVKGFARDTRERSLYLDFDHTIHSLKWFIPWFKDYAMNTAFLKISSLITITSILSLFFLNSFKKIQNISSQNMKIYLIITLALAVNLFVWFQAPEIRFGWGTIISLSCFYLSILIFNNKYFLNSNIFYFRYVLIFGLSLLVYDNYKNLNYNNLITSKQRNFDYSNIYKIGVFNGKDFYKSQNWQCADFEEICVNKIKKDYDFFRKYGYLIFLNTN